MRKKLRDQSAPKHVQKAKSFTVLLAVNPSGDNTKRTDLKWKMVLKYDGEPNGIAMARKELKHKGGFSSRYLAYLEREKRIKLDSEADTVASREGSSGKLWVGSAPVPEDDESSYPEGRAAYRLHRKLERDCKLAKRAKRKRLEEVGFLACDVCKFDFEGRFGPLGSGFVEAHHTRPVSELNGKAKTKIGDLALVCSNCHRMLHRGSRLLSLKDLRELIQPIPCFPPREACAE